jgi:SHS2 domain-containing protein
MNKFIFLKHTADVKFQAFGKNIEELFENSFLALNQSIYDNKKIKRSKEKIIKVSGKDYESLLYNFLEEIIYLLDADNFVCTEVKDIKIKGFKLSVILIGDKKEKYNFTNKIKAVTYNEMFVKKQDKIWKCQVVLDA